MQVSIIIPTYQEEASIGKLLAHIKQTPTKHTYELIVVDGGSSDTTVQKAEEHGAMVLHSKEQGRAAQMNAGAAHAQGDILYFLHADAYPPSTFLHSIVEAIESGYGFGHFRQKIISENKLVAINSFLSRLSSLAASGGDQSLFIKNSLFKELGGFNTSYCLMEDYDLVKRARKKAPWIKIPASLVVLDRKYAYNSFLRVNLVNAFIFLAYRLGVAPSVLKGWYKKLIKGPRYKELS